MHKWHGTALMFVLSAAVICRGATAPGRPDPAHNPAAVNLGVLDENVMVLTQAVSSTDRVPLETMSPDEHTVFLLQVDKKEIRDVTGRFKESEIAVKNALFVDDPCGMRVIRFAKGKPGAITITDQGQVDFKKGMAIEAWVYLESELERPFDFAVKKGPDRWRESFALRVVPGNALTLDFITMEGETLSLPTNVTAIATRPPRPHYPGPGDTMNGLNRFPANQWVHLAFTYEAEMRLLRTWVNFGVDREGVNQWSGIAGGIVDDDTAPLVLFNNAQDIRIAQIRFSDVGRVIGNADPMKVYVNELPYRGRTVVTLAQISDRIPIPSELTLVNGSAIGQKTLAYPLTHRGVQTFEVPPYHWGNAESDLILRVFHNRREVYKYTTHLINPSVKRPGGWRFLRTGAWEIGPQKPEWWINEDNSFSYRGKKVFPLSIFFVPPKDFDFVADLGFNQIDVLENKKQPVKERRALLDALHVKAEARGIWITAERDEEGRPAEGFIGAYDEPWGFSLESIRRKYMRLRDARSVSAELPVSGTQNNLQRYRETAQGTDVFGIDPYPIHAAMPARFVYDLTRIAFRETEGLKPVVPVLENYGRKDWRPNDAELRASVYLAIIAGANGLSFYSWDESSLDAEIPSTRALPEQVESYRKLLGELKQLEPVLVEPNLVANGAVCVPAMPRGFFVAAKKGGGRTCLFAASDLYQPERRTIVFPVAGNAVAKCISGGEYQGDLTFKNGEAELAMPPLGTAVFELK